MVVQDRNLRIHVSDANETHTWHAIVTRGLEDKIVPLETNSPRELGEQSAREFFVPFMAGFFAQAPVTRLPHLAGITHIWTSTDNESPIPPFILDDTGLTLGGIDQLEAHLGLRLTQPK
jgi:hypothetical protein